MKTQIPNYQSANCRLTWKQKNVQGPGDPAPSARQLVDKSMLQLKENLPMEGGIEPASDGDVFLSENSQVMDSSFFDQMSEVEKLRHQMFKVNRRITKLERLNSSLIEQKQIATYIAIAALSLSVFTLLVRRSPWSKIEIYSEEFTNLNFKNYQSVLTKKPVNQQRIHHHHSKSYLSIIFM